MAKLRLNDKTVRGLVSQPGRSYTEVWDTILPGFGVRVFASGRRSWFVRYRTNGRQVRSGLGQYPQVGVAEARELAQVKMNEPTTVETGAVTVTDLVELYQELHAPKKRQSSRVEDDRIIAKDIRPNLGTELLTNVGVAEVAGVIDGVARRGSPIMANRTRALLSKLWAFGMARGLVSSNPVTATERPGVERPRERVLSDDEIRQLWTVWESEGSLMSSLFQLLMLTAQRSGEVKAMAWDEIDGELWTIPAEKAKNSRSHDVPL